MVVVFQVGELDDRLSPIDPPWLITSISLQLMNATGVSRKDGPTSTALTAADLRASIDVLLRLAQLYRVRRRSLVLEPSAMDVSCQLESSP